MYRQNINPLNVNQSEYRREYGQNKDDQMNPNPVFHQRNNNHKVRRHGVGTLYTTCDTMTRPKIQNSLSMDRDPNWSHSSKRPSLKRQSFSEDCKGTKSNLFSIPGDSVRSILKIFDGLQMSPSPPTKRTLAELKEMNESDESHETHSVLHTLRSFMSPKSRSRPPQDSSGADDSSSDRACNINFFLKETGYITAPSVVDDRASSEMAIAGSSYIGDGLDLDDLEELEDDEDGLDGLVDLGYSDEVDTHIGGEDILHSPTIIAAALQCD